LPGNSEKVLTMSQRDAQTVHGEGGAGRGRSALARVLGFAGRLGLSALILGAGAAASAYWLTHRPKAQRRKPPPRAALVEVRCVQPEEHRVVVRALGTVVPARTIQLASRVSGEVVETAPGFMPGGRFQAGDPMVKIDPSDYELAIEQAGAELARRAAESEQQQGEISRREIDIELADIRIERSLREVERRGTDVVRAESAREVEEGQQSVAQREYELLGQTVEDEDRELVLRQPQLRAAQADYEAAVATRKVAEADARTAEASRRSAAVTKRTAEAAGKGAEAAVAAAEAALRRARLDLERTTIRAPFNAMVVERKIDLGSQVSPGVSLVSLVGTDEYWVQVSVPVDQLQWIDIPGLNAERGSSARVFHEAAWGAGASRTGTVKQLLTDLEPEGRMARVLVAVADPLALEASAAQRRPLILGAYVRVEIEGRRLPDVVRIGRGALRDGGRVWVMQPDNTLDIREVRVAWSGADHVCLAGGLAGGEKLVVSDLGAPVQGMALRTADSPPASAPKSPTGGTRPDSDSEQAR